jgi:hypothetical protein
MAPHLILAWLSAFLAVIVVVLAVVGGIRHAMPRFAIDRAILATEVSLGLALFSGVLELATTTGPSDGLHFVYAAVALIALPIGRLWGGIERGPRPWPLAIAGLVLLGVLIRLGQTG